MVCAGKLRFSAFQRTPCELCSFITFHFIVNSVKTFPENENGRKALSSAEASYIYTATRFNLCADFFVMITFELKKIGTSSLKHLKATIISFKMQQTRRLYLF